MARIKIIIEDDFGNRIEKEEPREYYLNIGKGTLNEIEGAVEEFKNRALSEIEKELLKQEQRRYIAEEKKEENTPAMEKDQ